MARRGKSFTTILKQAAREAERSRKRAERERVQKLNAMKREQAKAEKEYQKQLQKEYIESNQNYAKTTKENAENQRNTFLKIANHIHIKDKLVCWIRLEKIHLMKNVQKYLLKLYFLNQNTKKLLCQK